jgi:hypothetical protein
MSNPICPTCGADTTGQHPNVWRAQRSISGSKVATPPIELTCCEACWRVAQAELATSLGDETPDGTNSRRAAVRTALGLA